MLTVLGCAMHNQGERCVDVVLLLLQHGARVDAKDVCGKTALHYICGMSTIDALVGSTSNMVWMQDP
jgi:ankyrin repeat protein